MGESRRKRTRPGTRTAPGARDPRSEVRWLPLERIDLALEMLRGMVGEARESVPLYQEVRLDRAIVERMKRLFAERAEFLDIYREQLARWEREPLTARHPSLIGEGKSLVEEGTRLTRAFQEMADRATPIEDIMEMSDLEVGIRVAMGELPKAGGPLLEVPAAPPRPAGSAPPVEHEEDIPGLDAFRKEMTAAVDAYLEGVERWAGQVEGLTDERRALGRRAAVVLLESLHDLTRASEAEGVRIFNLMCRLQEWTQASSENHGFFAEAVLGARDPERRRGALREIAEDLGLAPAERDELVNLLDASARVTFGEAFKPGIA